MVSTRDVYSLQTLFSIFCSILFCKTKNNIATDNTADGIYIHFRTNTSIFNRQCLLAKMKTLEQLVLELLFHGWLHIDRSYRGGTTMHSQLFCIGGKGFWPNNEPEKDKHWCTSLHLANPTICHTSPLMAPSSAQWSGLHISGQCHANHATTSKDLNNHLSKANSSFGHLDKRLWQDHALCLSTSKDKGLL